MTGPTWMADVYPVTVVCGFCRCTLTISQTGSGPTTVTTGHAPGCVQNPARRRPARRRAT